MHIMTSEPISAQITQKRRAMSLSKTALANKAGVHVNTVSLIESGQTDPRWSVLCKILDVLEIPHPVEEAVASGTG